MGKEEQTGEVSQQHVKHILIVEDDADVGDVLVTLFDIATTYQSHLVHDGWQALHYVTQIRPDLLVLDYQLPGMNGLKLYDALHTIEGMEDVPALFVSANLPKKVLQERNLIGLEKPLNVDQFMKIVQAQLS